MWEEWLGGGGGGRGEEGRGGPEENGNSLLSFLAPMDTMRSTSGLSGEGWELASFLHSQNMLEMWPFQEGLVPMARGGSIPDPGRQEESRELSRE